ncbi:MAG: ChbG/HpnK family deacetylase [Burkholderiaceae bacterium]
MGTTQLWVCADDFGLHPAVDVAILGLAEQGRLSATSCLTDGPSFTDHAPQLLASGLQCGLHLNFTERLAADGLFLPLGKLIPACWMRRLDPAGVHDHIRRQFDRFEAVMGRLPDYVDGHQHVHQFPQIREALLRELDNRHVAGALRPWLRSTRAPRQPGVPAGMRIKAAIIALLGAGHYRKLAEARGYALNRGFLGVYGFEGGRKTYTALLRKWLAAAGDGDLIMCHPATGAVPGDTLGSQRLAEFEAWKSDEVGAWLQEYGITVSRKRIPA